MLQVEARSLLCYWAVRELGITLTELTRLFVISPFYTGYSGRRGDTIAEENDYQLMG
jgi:putative transposase